MEKLTVIDFFCGAGGFSEGFRQKGFKIISGYDNWQPAIDTFNHNFNTNSSTKDLLDFKNRIEEIYDLPNTDVIIGSPPCVSFSSSNISGKADKESGVLLTKIFLRIVAVKKFQKGSILKGWFMENVANSRNYLADYYTFNDLGLGDWARENKLGANKIAITLKGNQPLVNSADYGSYQARKRAISGEIIKKGKLLIPPISNSNTEDDNLPNWNTLGSLLKGFPEPNLKKSNKLIIDPIYPMLKIERNDLTDHFYDSGLYKSEWRQSKELKTNHYCMGKMSFPENIDKPSRTITATKSGTSREALVYKSEYKRTGNGEYRSPTIREAASIMGFPFTFQFLGTINSKWRLVGNAVCPSVSRAFASELLNQIGEKAPINLDLVQVPNLKGVNILNDYEENDFKKQPKRVKKSRFRRHPLKEGNLTVTLSNFDIEQNSKTKNSWFTSIQYGTGEGYKNQKVEDGFYKILEPLIEKEKSGSKFIKIINNGFSKKIGSAEELQKMYELQISDQYLMEPTELVETINTIIKKVNVSKDEFIQNGTEVFHHKDKVPMTQLFALYAINMASSLANKAYTNNKI